MRIAILGTRGIPNHYGGFEQCVEYLALGFVKEGHEVFVYNSHNHFYQQSSWRGINIIHVNDPEYKLGNLGQFIYDFNCIKHCRNQDYDIILQMGYLTSSIFGWIIQKNVIVTTNLEGLEWKRKRYNKAARLFIKYAEKLAIRRSDYLIADAIPTQTYLLQKYGKSATYIPYGANVFKTPKESLLKTYGVSKYQYNMFVGQIEEDSSIEILLQGVVKANDDSIFLVVGNHLTEYGELLKNKFKNCKQIKFLGGVFESDALNNLRYFSNIYFHGHTIGGTNPLLLEAMAAKSFISAHKNEFNTAILGTDAIYFENIDDVAHQIKYVRRWAEGNELNTQNNITKIEEIYNPENIVNLYLSHFEEIVRHEN